jgi:hypothetical protein
MEDFEEGREISVDLTQQMYDEEKVQQNVGRMPN